MLAWRRWENEPASPSRVDSYCHAASQVVSSLRLNLCWGGYLTLRRSARNLSLCLQTKRACSQALCFGHRVYSLLKHVNTQLQLWESRGGVVHCNLVENMPTQLFEGTTRGKLVGKTRPYREIPVYQKGRGQARGRICEKESKRGSRKSYDLDQSFCEKHNALGLMFDLCRKVTSTHALLKWLSRACPTPWISYFGYRSSKFGFNFVQYQWTMIVFLIFLLAFDCRSFPFTFES